MVFMWCWDLGWCLCGVCVVVMLCLCSVCVVFLWWLCGVIVVVVWCSCGSCVSVMCGVSVGFATCELRGVCVVVV